MQRGILFCISIKIASFSFSPYLLPLGWLTSFLEMLFHPTNERFIFSRCSERERKTKWGIVYECAWKKENASKGQHTNMVYSDSSLMLIVTGDDDRIIVVFAKRNRLTKNAVLDFDRFSLSSSDVVDRLESFRCGDQIHTDLHQQCMAQSYQRQNIPRDQSKHGRRNLSSWRGHSSRFFLRFHPLSCSFHVGGCRQSSGSGSKSLSYQRTLEKVWTGRTRESDA